MIAVTTDVINHMIATTEIEILMIDEIITTGEIMIEEADMIGEDTMTTIQAMANASGNDDCATYGHKNVILCL